MKLCKKCSESSLGMPIEASDKKCAVCKKPLRSKLLLVCGSCQSSSSVCIVCGKYLEH